MVVGVTLATPLLSARRCYSTQDFFLDPAQRQLFSSHTLLAQHVFPYSLYFNYVQRRQNIYGSHATKEQGKEKDSHVLNSSSDYIVWT